MAAISSASGFTPSSPLLDCLKSDPMRASIASLLPLSDTANFILISKDCQRILGSAFKAMCRRIPNARFAEQKEVYHLIFRRGRREENRPLAQGVFDFFADREIKLYLADLGERRILGGRLNQVVQRFPRITWLSLEDWRELTEDDVEALSTLRSLTHLDLSGCWNLDTEDLRPLQRLPIRHLDLNGCGELTDEALAIVRNIDSLRDLCLAYCDGLTEEALQHLAGTRLESLNLTGWDDRLTDLGLGHIANCRYLKDLDLASCDVITDEGLRRLEGLPLEELNAHNEHLTEEGVQRVLDSAPKRRKLNEG